MHKCSCTESSGTMERGFVSRVLQATHATWHQVPGTAEPQPHWSISVDIVDVNVSCYSVQSHWASIKQATNNTCVLWHDWPPYSMLSSYDPVMIHVPPSNDTSQQDVPENDPLHKRVQAVLAENLRSRPGKLPKPLYTYAKFLPLAGHTAGRA